ncbi:MAG: hypothetical protein M3462_10235 [Chloroflexota bacterium]|nr:hypothetical protein [Chloroflexota bacterium]
MTSATPLGGVVRCLTMPARIATMKSLGYFWRVPVTVESAAVSLATRIDASMDSRAKLGT